MDYVFFDVFHIPHPTVSLWDLPFSGLLEKSRGQEPFGGGVSATL
jgi:hypothetical protein